MKASSETITRGMNEWERRTFERTLAKTGDTKRALWAVWKLREHWSTCR